MFLFWSRVSTPHYQTSSLPMLLPFEMCYWVSCILFQGAFPIHCPTFRRHWSPTPQHNCFASYSATEKNLVIRYSNCCINIFIDSPKQKNCNQLKLFENINSSSFHMVNLFSNWYTSRSNIDRVYVDTYYITPSKQCSTATGITTKTN